MTRLALAALALAAALWAWTRWQDRRYWTDYHRATRPPLRLVS